MTYLLDEEGEYVYEWCPEGCNDVDGTCDKVFDTQGDPCDATTFKNQCIHEGDSFYASCSNSGKIEGIPCSSGKSCHYSLTVDDAGCTEPCTEAKVEKECGLYSDGGAIVAAEVIEVCEDVGSGQLFGFSTYKLCEHGCNAAGTACAEAPDGT